MTIKCGVSIVTVRVKNADDLFLSREIVRIVVPARAGAGVA